MVEYDNECTDDFRSRIYCWKQITKARGRLHNAPPLPFTLHAAHDNLSILLFFIFIFIADAILILFAGKRIPGFFFI